MALEQLLVTLLPKYEGPGPRYTSYPPIPYWGGTSGEEVGGWLAETPADHEAALSLYTHIPFCRSRCHYCGCFVIITPHHEPAERYLGAVRREMELVAERLPPGTRVRQYHLGGGTPNFISPGEMGSLVDLASRLFAFQDDMEMSIEVDPRHLGEQELSALRMLGFNRLSMGIQDFDEEVQRGVNRIQPFERVARLVENAERLGYLSINFDLIYGLPHQTRETFARTVERVLQLRPDRIALYNFAYLPQAFPHQRKMEAASLPDAQEKLAIFLMARERLTGNGYLAIGLDHFALVDDELAIAYGNGTMRRNFMGYTTQAGVDLLAFGVSGISEFNGRFWQNEKKLSRYERMLAEDRLPPVRGLLLDREDRLRQTVIADLFCKGGFHFESLERTFGPGLREHLARELEQLVPLAGDGLVALEPSGVRVTELGRFFLRNIAMVFDHHLHRHKEPVVQFSRTL
jgi:oxygen-independent coproporphyrinogen-3 oxidase